MTPEDKALIQISNIVKGSDFEGKTFLAGGAVRDEIMGKSLKDIDIVVSMPDGGVKFAEWITKKLNLAPPVIFQRFGTAKFDINGVDIEVVMTRGEKYEKGSRKPDVVYADLEDDAFRRDLTVNSLFKDVVTGEIKDLTKMGISDIKNGIVRTPTDPNQTFADDPLRMLRAIRFMVKYNWKMPRYMIRALKNNADSLQSISQERIRDELNKMLMTENPDKALKMLTLTGLNKHVIPELDLCRGVKQNEYHKHDVYNHILEVVKNTPMDLQARLSSLFHDIGKPKTKSVGPDGRVHFYQHEDVGAEMAETIMSRLKYTNDQINTVKNIVSSHMMLKSTGKSGEAASDKQLRKFAARLGNDLSIALKTMHADNISHKEEASMPNQIPNIIKKYQALAQTIDKKPKLPINGNDIMKALNLKPGPEIKNLLNIVQDAWFENPDITPEDALKLVKSAYQKQPNKKKDALASMLKTKIKNPKTKNDILIKTALGYDKKHPARIAAINFLKKQKHNNNI